MTITQSQLNDLKQAHDRNPANHLVADLIEKWGAEIFVRESSKSGNIIFTLENMRKTEKTEKREVVAVKVADGFALHKDAWGGTFWVLTHMASGIKTLSGKKVTLSKVVKEFAAWQGVSELDKAMTVYGIDALKNVPENLITEYRALYEKAGF